MDIPDVYFSYIYQTPSTMFTAILFCLLGSAFSQNTKTNTLTKTTNNVKGDQSYGGIHLFEWHGEHGGIGLGWKILLALLILLAIGYWWTKKKAILNALGYYQLCSMHNLLPQHRLQHRLRTSTATL